MRVSQCVLTSVAVISIGAAAAFAAGPENHVTIGGQHQTIGGDHIHGQSGGQVILNPHAPAGGNPTIAKPGGMVEVPPHVVKVEALHKVLKGDPSDLLGKRNQGTSITITLDKGFKSAKTVGLKCSDGFKLPANVTFPAGITGITVDGSVVMLTPPRKVDIDITVMGRTFRKVLVCNIRPNVSGVAGTDRTGFFGGGFQK